MAEDPKLSSIAPAAPPADTEGRVRIAHPTATSPRWRWLLWLSSALVAVFLTLTAVLAFLATTPSGLRWGVALAERLLPLNIAQVEGRLSDRLRLTDLVLELPGLGLRLKGLELDWHPPALLAGRLAIARLAVQDLEIRLPQAQRDEAPLRLPAVILPLAIEAGEIALDGLSIRRRGESEPLFVMASARLIAGQLAGGLLQVGRLEGHLGEPALHLKLAGQANLTGAYPLTLDLAWDLTLASGVVLTGAGRLDGDLQRLHLRQTLTGALAAQMDAELQGLLADLSWHAQVQIERIEAPALVPELPAVAIQGHLASEGRLRNAQLTGQVALRVPLDPEPLPLIAQLEGRWQEDRFLIQTLELSAPENGARFGMHGGLDLGQTTLGLTFEGDWQGLRWPLTGEQIAHSSAGHFVIKGDRDAFSYQLRGQLSGPRIPEAMIELGGQGSMRDTRVDTLVIQTLEGRLEGEGHLSWSPELDWVFALAATDVNPGAHVADWPGRLSGRINTQGRPQQWILSIADVQGELRGYPLAADAELMAQDSDDIAIKSLRLISGPSRLKLTGRIAQSLDLRLDLDAPDLASLWPKAAGKLKITAQLSGARQSPSLQLDLKGEQIRLDDRTLAGLDGSVELDLGSSRRAALRLKGRDLKIGALAWSAFELASTGTLVDHRIQARLQGTPLTLALEAQGVLSDGGRYGGRVTRLDLERPDLGRWSLQRPLHLSREGTHLGVGPLCLRNAKGSGGCLGFDQSAPGRWGLDLELDRIDMALLKGVVLPDSLEAEGSVRLKGHIQADGPLLSGETHAEVPRGRLRFKAPQGQGETLDLAGSRLAVTASRAGLEAHLELPLGRLGRVQSELNLPGWRLDQTAPPLRGRILAELPTLAPLATLIPDIGALQGAFQSNLLLSGTLARPLVSGQLQLRDVRFQVPLLALKVEDLDLEADASPNGQLAIRGQARLGGGRLDLNGQGQTLADRPWIRLELAGERLKLVDTREYVVYVEPRLELGLDREGAQVRGEVRIPEARIRPRALPPGTISASRDVTLVSEQGGRTFPLSLDVRLVLGDEVSMDGFGLRGRLAGDLHLLQMPGREPLGDGQLQIIDGQYRLTSGLGIAAELGAPLNITQGRLIFAKSPLGNPGLWLQAERQGGDLTAGVRVVGTLRQPKLTFFSETDPGLTQSDITKYLMTGIPPTANDRAEQAGLAIGTYVAPKVYMEYESGLGGDSNRLKLRYDLSKHIELQAETGAKQGADVFFKFEH